LTGERVVRRLAAILAADVAGYSRLMGRDENGTLVRLKAHRTERLEPALVRHGGRLVKLSGDGALVEFPSAVDALSAAIELQQAMSDANRGQPEDTAIVFRVGLHLGDLIVDGDDLYGDGVNVAARLEAEAPVGGIVISRNVHDAAAGRLKATFSDLGELALKNIERPIQAFKVNWDPADWKITAPPAVAPPAATPATADGLLALPDKPSIAVLPFQNMSADPEQEYFVDGLVEDIITALSRFRSLFVIARNSSFTYRGRAVDIKQVGRELGVRYVLEGSVRKAGNRVRITGQLVQADTGAHIWAERYDGEVTDVFDLQDKVTLDVVGAITPKLERAEIERTQYKPTDSHHAYDCCLRGVSLVYAGADKLKDARHWFYRAIELDPNYAPAHAWAAITYSRSKGQGITLDEAEIAETIRLATRAAQLDSQDSLVLSLSGWVLAFVAGDLVRAASMTSRALALHPNLAAAWGMSGWINTWLGKPDAAVEHFERAIRLSPRDPTVHFMQSGSAHGHMMAGRYHEAQSFALMAAEERPVAANYRIAAASAALAGQIDDARKFAGLLLQADPRRRMSNLVDVLGPYKRAQDIERYKEGLRLAGLPE
jgi:TolB-like protein/class 3 adenylate cyclase/tetratricopeptide (TPR) repeat protein